MNAGLANRNIFARASRPGSPAAVLAGAVVGGDPFLMKFNPAGSAPEYLRLLGGSEFDQARGVAIGPDGSAFVTGMTASADFPVMNAQQPALAGSAMNDAFVVKVDSGGNTVYSTYLGGTSGDQAFGVAVGADGGTYVVGQTTSQDFPRAGTGNPLAGISDAFVTRLNPNGSELLFSTCFGGAEQAQANGVALDGEGGIYVVGTTFSTNLPLSNATRGTHGGGGGVRLRRQVRPRQRVRQER